MREKYGGAVGERFGPTLAVEHLVAEDKLKLDDESRRGDRLWMLAEGSWSREQQVSVSKIVVGKAADVRLQWVQSKMLIRKSKIVNPYALTSIGCTSRAIFSACWSSAISRSYRT